MIEKLQAHYGFIPRAFRREGTIIFVTANVAIRRSLFEAVGGFRWRSGVGGEEQPVIDRAIKIPTIMGSRRRGNPPKL